MPLPRPTTSPNNHQLLLHQHQENPELVEERKVNSFEMELATPKILKEQRIQEIMITDGNGSEISKWQLFAEKHSMFLAYMAALTYAIHNFVIEELSVSRGSVDLIFPQFIGFIGYFVVYHATIMIKNSNETGGFLWSRENSVFYKNGKQRFDYFTLVCLILKAVFQMLVIANVCWISDYSRESGINPGVVQLIVSLSVFFAAVLFYIFYQQKLEKQQFAGITFIIVCSLFVAFSKDDKKKNELSSDYKSLTPLIPIAFAISQSIIMAIGVLINKIMHQRGYSQMQFVADFLFIDGIFMFILFTIRVFQNHNYSWPQFTGMFFCSIMTIISQLCGNHAMIYGRGGVCAGIIQMSSVIQIMFESVANQRMPNNVEFGAVIFGVVGTFLISITSKNSL